MSFFLTKCRDVTSPFKSTPDAGAWDFCVPNDYMPLVLKPGEGCKIPSGIKAIVPKGRAFVAFNKSGVSTKNLVIKTAEFVDADYVGEIHLCIVNVSTDDFYIQPGMPLVQFALLNIDNNPYTMLDQTKFAQLADISGSTRIEKSFGEATREFRKSQNLQT